MNAAYGLGYNHYGDNDYFPFSHIIYIRKGVNHRLVFLLLLVYLTIEGSFLIANLHKFKSGGWFTILFASMYFIVMVGWYFGRKTEKQVCYLYKSAKLS